MTEELEYLIKRDLNISYDSEEVINDLELELLESGNVEVDVFYKIIDLRTDITLPFDLSGRVDFGDNDYPIYIDYMTLGEIAEFGVEEDLKGLNFLKMKIKDAIELFAFQDKMIKDY